MQEISGLIIELLKSHNRVSLPGLGAFMATPQAAVINEQTKTITPPSKKISFSKSETWNDGLLEQLYAERHEITVDDARDRLRHLISEVRFELDATGKLTLPGLGTLRQSQMREMSFGLDKSLNLKADSYGLGEVKIDAGAEVYKDKRKKNTESGTNRFQLILLGIMVLIISAVAFYLFLNTRGRENYELINPQLTTGEEPPSSSLSLPPAPAPEFVPEFDPLPDFEPDPLPEPTPALPTPQQASPAPAPAPATPSPAASDCEYCVVATSLSTLEGARQRAETYRQEGYDTRVVPGDNNRYRVTVGCYRDGAEAQRQRREVQKFISDAWVLEVCR